MSIRSALENLFFTIAGLPLGSRFSDALTEMRRVQWSSTEELHARSEERLRLLLKHSAENVPYYRDLYRQLGIAPGELRTVRDLQALPIFTKSDYMNCRPEAFRATTTNPSLRIEGRTSGSTGQPFQYSLDRRALPIVFASHLFYDSWHGLRPFDRYMRIVAPAAEQSPLPENASFGVRLRATITSRLKHLYESWTQERISLWEVDSRGAESIWRRLESFRPKFVMGYTSTLAAIADELMHRDLRLVQPVRGVIAIAETLTPNRRKLIEEYFQAPIINRYGLREFGSWSAQSCAESPDRFHVNTELVVFEVVRQDGTPCAAGETGRIVLTDLHNFARPFIRYDTGDVGVACAERCSCRRGFPLLGAIEGRSVECLRTPSGREISPTILGHFLFVYHDHSATVRHYQLVQQTPNRVSLLIVPASEWDEQRRIRLRSDLRQLLGGEMDVDIETVRDIPPEKSGKRPIIKLAANQKP